MTEKILEQRLGKVVAKLENFDGLREVKATVGQVRLLGEVVAKL